MTDATVAAPASSAARRYSEHVHILVDRQTREYLLGAAILDARRGGYDRPREAQVARDLLDIGINRRYRDSRPDYAEAVLAGRAELERREAEAGEAAAA